MLSGFQPDLLVASPVSALLNSIESVLLASGARVSFASSAEAALHRIVSPDPPGLAILDVRLADMPMGQVLAAVRSCDTPRCAILLVADMPAEEWADRLREGVIDGLVPAGSDAAWWPLYVENAFRTAEQWRALDSLREASAGECQFDALTGAYTRPALMSLLFRETDRVQRMSTSLCAILFDVDDFGHWNERLGNAACDRLLVEVRQRIQRLLRSYDLLGRMGEDEFLAALPGCSPSSAVLLAERIRNEVFAEPFRVAAKSVRLSACFAVAASHGRSPVVLLRDLETALRLAKETGPETIRPTFDCPDLKAAPVAFLSPSSGDELLAW